MDEEGEAEESGAEEDRWEKHYRYRLVFDREVLNALCMTVG